MDRPHEPYRRRYLAATVATLDEILAHYRIGPAEVAEHGPIYQGWTPEERGLPLDTARPRGSFESYARAIYQRAHLLSRCALNRLLDDHDRLDRRDPWSGLSRKIRLADGLWASLPNSMVAVAHARLRRSDPHMGHVGQLLGVARGHDRDGYDADGGPLRNETRFVVRHFDGSVSNWTNCAVFPVPDLRLRRLFEHVRSRPW